MSGSGYVNYLEYVNYFTVYIQSKHYMGYITYKYI